MTASVLVAWLAFGSEAWSHGGSNWLPPEELAKAQVPWLQWDFHPSIVIGIVTFTIVYTLGITVWRKKYKLAEKVEWQYPARFYTAMVAQWWILDGPLHYLSDERSFLAHMAQHLLLQMIWAPLLISGVPGWLLRPLVKPAWVRRFGRWITHPARVLVLFNAVLLGWHLPWMYEWALREHPVHIFQHLLFMSTAVIFWWPVMSPLPEVPRAPYGWQALYLLLQMLPMKGLGLVIATHTTLIYTFYASQPRVWGLTPLGDQRLGGLVMWVIGGLPLWVALGYVFLKWGKSGTPSKGMTGVASLDKGRKTVSEATTATTTTS